MLFVNYISIKLEGKKINLSKSLPLDPPPPARSTPCNSSSAHVSKCQYHSGQKPKSHPGFFPSPHSSINFNFFLRHTSPPPAPANINVRVSHCPWPSQFLLLNTLASAHQKEAHKMLTTALSMLTLQLNFILSMLFCIFHV